MMSKIWKWLNHVSVYGGWSPLQAIVFIIWMSPVLYLIWATEHYR